MKSQASDFVCCSTSQRLDTELNASLGLAGAIMNRWLSSYATVVYARLTNPDLSQAALGEKLGIAQNTVSERLARAEMDLLSQYEQYFRQRLSEFNIET
jgi:hypothetical protein